MDSSLCDVVVQGLRPSAHPEHEDAVDALSLRGGESPEARPANPEEGEGTCRLWYVFRPPCRSSPSSRVPSKRPGPRSTTCWSSWDAISPDSEPNCVMSR